MRLLLLLLLISCSATSFCQYEVLEAKRVRIKNSNKIKKGDFLKKDDLITIEEKGFITLDVESAMHMKLTPGNYIVGAEIKRHNEWYETHLTLTQQLKSDGMITCKFRYKTLAVPGSNRHYEVDRIELDQRGLVRIDSDTTKLTISWANPEYKYKRGYRLVIRDFYNNGFIDIIKTTENKLTFYPGRYGHKHMYYNIIADNCRASLRYKIEVTSPEAKSNKATTFN